MPHPLRSSLYRLAASAVVLACTGCGYDPEADLETRGCLWVYDVARHGEAFVGREVPVCGSIALEGADGRLRLKDSMKPQLRVIVQLPAAPNGDAGVVRVLDAVAAGRRSGRVPYFEARYHGRVELSRDHENVLHVTRVDWLDGRPPEWR